MRTLVTGGAGFIGSHTVAALLARGHDVTVADDLSTGRAGHVPPGAALHQVSILDREFAAVCRGADAVIHAAAQTSVAASGRDPAADATVNILGTIRAVQAAAEGGARRFIYLSSAAVYGGATAPPVTEAAPAAPASPYGLSKLVGEWYTRQLAGAAGLEWVILRLANVYGPRQSPAGEAGVVARWAAALTDGAPLLLHGDGCQTRDFVYAGDVALAAAAATEAPGAPGQIFNVGTGCETPIHDLLAALEGLTGTQAAVRRQEPPPGDLRRSALDAGRLRAALGWAPRTSLDEGLRLTVDWMRQAD